MPVVQILVDRHDREAAGREQLLALRQLWRSVERHPQAPGPRPSECVEVTRRALVRELEELIAALDRRVPRVEQAGEAAIARDAGALRAKAVARLEQLNAGRDPAAP